MINNVVIMGRLTKEPEERVTSSGKKVCSFCVALDDNFDKSKTYFFDIIAWNKTCEFVCKYFHKGSMIAIQGRLTTNPWEDKNGSKHKGVAIVADNVSFCGGKNESNTGSIDVPPPTDTEYRDIPETDEELPF